MKANIEIISRNEERQGFNKNLGVYSFGKNNLYPDEMENIILSSVTAKRCANKVKKYIIGKGFGKDLDKLVVSNTGKTLYQVLKGVAKDTAFHNGFVLHVNWGLNSSGKLVITDFDHIALSYARKGDKDDTDYIGKVGIHSDWKNAKKDDIKFVDTYNPTKEVVTAQIDKAGGFQDYRGQILYYNFDEGRIYPISPMEVVEDAGYSQRAIQRLNRNSLERGRFGTTVILTESFIDSDLDLETDEGKIQFKEQEKGQKNFRDGLRKAQGVNSTETIMHIGAEMESGQKLDDVIKVVSLDSNINDKMFETSRKSSKEDICEAFRVPIELLLPKTGMFGKDGNAYTELKLELQEDTEEERDTVEDVFNDIFSRMDEPREVKIIKLINDANNGERSPSV